MVLGYGAMLLWGGAPVAIGMFISSLTESQMVAALRLLRDRPGVDADQVRRAAKLDEPLRSTLDYLAVDSQLQNLLKGVLDLKPIVFFSSASSRSSSCSPTAPSKPSGGPEGAP